MEEDDRLAKQTYLRTEIMNKGYDTDSFILFLEEKKSGDFDIDNFTMEELKKLVYEFKVKNHSPSIQNENINSEHLEHHSDEEEESKEGIFQKKTENQTKVQNVEIHKEIENYKETVPCQKLENTVLWDYHSLKITVSRPEKFKGGLFSSDYITYLVSTENLGLKVRRRYSDFEWLRKNLSIIFPGLLIPPIPRKNSTERFQEELINERMRDFEKFMDSLSKNTSIKNSKIFYDFLSVEETKEFHAIKKETSNKLKPFSKVSELKTIEGEFNLKITDEYNQMMDGVRNYVSFNDGFITRLKESCENLMLEISAVSKRMREISEIFNSMYLLSEKTSDRQIVKDTYSMMTNVMNKWSDAHYMTNVVIEGQFLDFFHFMRKEYNCFRELLERTETAKSLYHKSEKNLLNKKEELFKLGNTLKWEMSPDDLKNHEKNVLTSDKELAFRVMCSKDNIILHNLKQQYAYYATSLFSEYERMRNLYAERFSKQFVNFSSRNVEILTNLNVMWADFSSYYVV